MSSEEAWVTLRTAAGLLGSADKPCPSLGQPLYLYNEGTGEGPSSPNT